MHDTYTAARAAQKNHARLQAMQLTESDHFPRAVRSNAGNRPADTDKAQGTPGGAATGGHPTSPSPRPLCVLLHPLTITYMSLSISGHL